MQRDNYSCKPHKVSNITQFDQLTAMFPSILSPSLPAQITHHKSSHRLIGGSDLFLTLAVSCRLMAISALLICVFIYVLF